MQPVRGLFNNYIDKNWNLLELSFHIKESSLGVIDRAEQQYARGRSGHLAMGCQE